MNCSHEQIEIEAIVLIGYTGILKTVLQRFLQGRAWIQSSNKALAALVVDLSFDNSSDRSVGIFAVDVLQRVEQRAVVSESVTDDSVVTPVVPRRLEKGSGGPGACSADGTNFSMEGTAIFTEGAAVPRVVSDSVGGARSVVKSATLSFSEVEGLSEGVVDLVPAGTFEHSESELGDSHVLLGRGSHVLVGKDSSLEMRAN